MEALVGLAAVLALVAVALPWWMGRPQSGIGGPGTSESPSTPASLVASASASLTDPATSSGPSLASVAPTNALAFKRGRIWDWTFDYPSDWPVQDNGNDKMPIPGAEAQNIPTSLALGTIGRVAEVCLDASVFPHADCSVTWDLVPSSVAITFEFNGMSGTPGEIKSWTLLDAAMTTPPAGTRVVTVAGVRALYARSSSDRLPLGTMIVLPANSIPGADEVLVWEMVDRFDAMSGFKITAAIRGPDVARLEAQVQAVVDSLTYVPAITPLPMDAASKKSALAASIAAWTKRFSPAAVACFSDTPGATTSATITEALTVRKLSKPLAVRCTPRVDILPEQVWKVTFTYQWDAAAGHPAGTAAFVDIGGLADDNFDHMPYLLPMPQFNG